MKPDTTQILDSIISSLSTYIEPEVSSPFARSVMVTVGNLLRHVKLRVEDEAELLFDDNTDLESVLGGIATRLGAHEILSVTLGSQIEELQGALENDVLKNQFPSTARLDKRNAELREVLDGLLRALSEVRADFKMDETYQEVRREIRECIGRQLQRADRLISPAFIGGRR